MITTIKSIIQQNGRKKGAEIKVDAYLALNSVVHICSIMFTTTDSILVRIDRRYTGIIPNYTMCNDLVLLREQDVTKLGYAEDKSEACRDYLALMHENKEALSADFARKEKAIRNALDALVEAVSDAGDDIISMSLCENDKSKLSRMIRAMSDLGYVHEDYCIPNTDYDSLRDIVLYKKILVYNEKLEWESLNLQQAVKIKAGVDINGRDAIIITLVDGSEYFVLKDAHDYYYKILYALYGE